MPEIKTSDTDVLILCGGLGTRFKKVRDDIPKSLAPIRGIPFIDFLLNDLIDQGFFKFILATGHLGNQIEAHVNQRTVGKYIFSNESKPMGTGGAVKLAEKNFSSDRVLILNGDSYITFNFLSLLKFHSNCNAEMSLLLSSSKKGDGYGNVLLNKDNRIITFSEKPAKAKFSFVNAGVYCLDCTLLRGLDPEVEYSIEKDWIPFWIPKHRIFGLQTDQTFHDIGTSKRYRLIQSKL